MAAAHQSPPPPIPAAHPLPPGKTTLLRYLLENSKEKIACIVNDVASINIDAKLVRNDRCGGFATAAALDAAAGARPWVRGGAHRRKVCAQHS